MWKVLFSGQIKKDGISHVFSSVIFGIRENHLGAILLMNVLPNCTFSVLL